MLPITSTSILHSFDYNKNDIILIKSWNGKRLFPLGVVGNIETGKYHLPNVRHLPTKDKSVSYKLVIKPYSPSTIPVNINQSCPMRVKFDKNISTLPQRSISLYI